MPRVSIVLPVYNGEHYLRESLDSIVQQSFTDWELIIVNDCSTDSTSEIVKEYLEKDTRIKVINNIKNEKLPKSLNIGFKNAKGKYLTWTSDDNRYRENALQKMYDILSRDSSVGLVYACMMNIDKYGNELGTKKMVEEEELLFGNIIGACFMYKREVMESIGEYNTELFGAEDYDYWLRIAEKYQVVSIDDVLYDYRRHEESLSSTKKELIKKQVCKIKKKNIISWIEKNKENKEILCRLFFDYLQKVGKDDNVFKSIEIYFPYMRFFKHDLKENPVIIFGAGNIGREAKKLLKNQVIAFADNDQEKIGKIKEGIPIISFQEMMEREEDIVIAISSSKISEIIMQMEQSKEKNFYVYPYFINAK